MRCPRHSVILPVHNGQDTLQEALNSIQNQHTDAIEVLAINDHSTDRSLHILESWSDRLPLRILTPETGGNWMAATNLGLAQASGSWIHFLHQDDRWESNRLTRLEEAQEKFPQAHFFCHDTWFIDASGKKRGTWKTPWPPDTPLTADSILPRYCTQNILGIPSVCFEKGLLKTVGLLREDLWFLADWDFWLRMINASDQIIYLNEPLAEFRIHSKSQTSTRTSEEDSLRWQFSEIRTRVTSLCGTHPRKKAANINEEMTITLANWSHGQKGYLLKTICGLISLGPAGFRTYLSETRLLERVWPRLLINIRR